MADTQSQNISKRAKRVVKIIFRAMVTIFITISLSLFFFKYLGHNQTISYLAVCFLRLFFNFIVVFIAFSATGKLDKMLSAFALPLLLFTTINYVLFLIFYLVLSIDFINSIILSNVIIFFIDSLIFYDVLLIKCAAGFKDFSINSKNIMNDFIWYWKIHFGKLLQLVNFKKGYKLKNYFIDSTSYFFRDFDYQDDILNYYLKGQKKELRILCTGCATGQEPYSVAMFCHDKNIQTSIVGIDISKQAIRKAQKGHYDIILERNRNSHNFIDTYLKYFDPIKSGSNIYVVSESIKGMVKFYTLDICDIPARFYGQYDFVFARKYLYYLPAVKQKIALENIRLCLKRKNKIENIFFCGYTKKNVKEIGSLIY